MKVVLVLPPRPDGKHQGDSSEDASLNGCVVDGERVSWAVAFPRPEWDNPEFWSEARPAESANHS